MSRTASEIEADITACRAAISSAMSAAGYGIGGRSVTRQRLTDLREWLHELQAELGRMSGGDNPMIVRGVVEGL